MSYFAGKVTVYVHNGNIDKSDSKTINNINKTNPFDLQITHLQTLNKKNMNKLIDDIKNNCLNETIKYVWYNR